ncbi:MAG: hypothetical protein CL920_07485 [Deltaproteobacteria bacterium]|nr:hypothetical protein [Deltaproteobacteria bacterium]MBU48520.1 hypothetical protein [Deltaproteobacteria bacterium]|tara:strand:+ start:11550 stop:12458 length:909 start_codon:yes stop_codon:yes gene_type:complete
MAGNPIFVKLLVEEPEKDPYVLTFEKKMIKIGRGARKGVDVALDDPKVARMHATITAKEKGASIMSMGTPIEVDGKTPKGKGKLANGTIIQIGNTQLTSYVGAEAEYIDPLASMSTGDDAPGTILEHPPIEGSLPPAHGLHEGAPVEQGTMEQAPVQGADPTASAFTQPQNVDQMSSPFAAPGGHPTTPSSEEYEDGGYEIEEEQQLNTSQPVEQTAPPTNHGFQQSQGMAPPSAPPPTQGFDTSTANHNLYPMHGTATIAFGPWGPPPPALPEQFTPSISSLLEVFDRLGKESWYTQENLW